MLSFSLKPFISQLFPSATILKIPFVIQTQYQVNTGFGLVFLSLGNAAVLWPRNLFWCAGCNQGFLNICQGVLLHVSSCLQLKCCGEIIQRLGRDVWKNFARVMAGGGSWLSPLQAGDGTDCRWPVGSRRALLELPVVNLSSKPSPLPASKGYGAFLELPKTRGQAELRE